jgi:hypothetical protein
MDTSSDGILAPPPHSPSLINLFHTPRDRPDAPIVLSSDSETTSPVPAPAVPVKGHEGASTTEHAASSPLLNEGGVGATHSDHSLMEGNIPSDDTPIDSVSSWGRDAGHPLELSSDPSTHSSLRSSEIPDVPDMGSARCGGKMSTNKVTEAFEGASPAVLARACYLNVVPARDTRSASRELGKEPGKANAILHKFATADLTDGGVFTYDNMDVAHEEVSTTLQGATDELNSVRMGFSHYFLRDPIKLVKDPSIPVESIYLQKMADIVGAILCGGPCTTNESEDDVYASLLPGDWFCLATFILVAIVRGCIRSTDLAGKGAFDIHLCKDDFIFDSSITAPTSHVTVGRP